MLKAYEFRIYPTKEQENIFNQTLGLCRLYWNIIVANKNENHDMLIQGYKPIFEKSKLIAGYCIKFETDESLVHQCSLFCFSESKSI